MKFNLCDKKCKKKKKKRKTWFCQENWHVSKGYTVGRRSNVYPVELRHGLSFFQSLYINMVGHGFFSFIPYQPSPAFNLFSLPSEAFLFLSLHNPFHQSSIRSSIAKGSSPLGTSSFHATLPFSMQISRPPAILDLNGWVIPGTGFLSLRVFLKSVSVILTPVLCYNRGSIYCLMGHQDGFIHLFMDLISEKFSIEDGNFFWVLFVLTENNS